MKSENHNVLHILWPLLRVMQVVGLCPFQLVKGRVIFQWFSFQMFRLFCNLALVTTYIVFQAIQINRHIRRGFILGEDVGIHVHLGCGFYSTIIQFAMTSALIIKRNKLVKFYDQLSEMRNQLNRFFDASHAYWVSRKLFGAHVVMGLTSSVLVGISAWHNPYSERFFLNWYPNSGNVGIGIGCFVQFYIEFLKSFSCAYVEIICGTMARSSVKTIKSIQEYISPLDLDSKVKQKARKGGTGRLRLGVSLSGKIDQEGVYFPNSSLYGIPTKRTRRTRNTTSNLHKTRSELTASHVLKGLQRFRRVSNMQTAMNDLFGFILAQNVALMVITLCILCLTKIEDSSTKPLEFLNNLVSSLSLNSSSLASQVGRETAASQIALESDHQFSCVLTFSVVAVSLLSVLLLTNYVCMENLKMVDHTKFLFYDLKLEERENPFLMPRIYGRPRRANVFQKRGRSQQAGSTGVKSSSSNISRGFVLSDDQNAKMKDDDPSQDEGHHCSEEPQEETSSVPDIGIPDVQDSNDDDQDQGQCGECKSPEDEAPRKLRDFGTDESQDVKAGALDLEQSELEPLELEPWELEPRSTFHYQDGDDYLDFGLRKCESDHYFPAEVGVCEECGGNPVEDESTIPSPLEEAESLAEFGLLRCINAHVFPKMLRICDICGMRTPEYYNSEIESRLRDFHTLGAPTASKRRAVPPAASTSRKNTPPLQEVDKAHMGHGKKESKEHENDRKQSTTAEKLETEPRSLHTRCRPDSLTWIPDEEELPFSGLKTRPPR